MQKPVIIFYNPNSGRFSNKRLLKIHAIFSEYFSNCRLISDISELRTVAQSHIVALGGDGTFHVAINNADLASNTFSLLPMGSGNDFVSAFPKNNVKHLCQKIQAQNIFNCDLIKIGNLYAHTVTGIGFEALVSKKANESNNIIPALKFIIPVLKYMFVFKPMAVKIMAPDFNYEGKAFMVSMGNGKRAGGGFKLFPKAELNDGKLDLLVITTPTFIQKLMYIGLVNFGKHLNLNIVKYVQLTALKIEINGTTALNADGDVYTTESIEIKVEKEVMKIVQ